MRARCKGDCKQTDGCRLRQLAADLAASEIQRPAGWSAIGSGRTAIALEMVD
ncbi:hypothetical protein [Bradyrhizobium sp. SZCCHNR2009]|uniref:hypothetical protein n=1 Tax=Bradyrhizobium sp. SZCCHNR2009 TaxID=3057375 RepID=UPI0028E992AC|nr:hypothetical protein [Bradyrhizobium sp. SZCCHNR2009]